MSHQNTTWTDVISGQSTTSPIVADVPNYTKANLPASVAGGGRLARVTDNVRGLWMDQGSQWFSLSGKVVNVEEFGAKGDGAMDNSTALAAAEAAIPSGGGTIIIPPGTYNHNSQWTISRDDVVVIGAGRNRTKLRCTNANIDAVLVTGARPVLRDLDIGYSVPAAGGSEALHILGSSRGEYANLTFVTNIATAIFLEAAAGGSDPDCVRNRFVNIIIGPTTNHGVILQGSSANNRVLDTRFEHLLISSVTNDAFRILDWVQGTFFDAWTTFDFCGRGLIIAPTVASRTFDIFVNEMVFDAITGRHLEATLTTGLHVSNSWFGAAPTGNYSIVLTSTVSRSDIRNSTLASRESGGAPTGIIYSDAGTVLIAGNQFIQGAVAPSTTAITLDTSSSLSGILDNQFVGFAANKCITNNGTSNTVVDNPGYNPVGISTITVTASPFTYTSGASPESIYIYAGTVSDVSIGGSTVATASPAQVELPPNTAVVVTYSSAPTMKKYVH